MAQVTPEQLGLSEFNPRGTQAEELQFLIAYYLKLLQTTGISISPGDIEIGAVEIKNGTSDLRATVTASLALKVDGSAVTQPISAASLPLPTNAAQETGGTLSSIDGSASNIDINTFNTATSSSNIDTSTSSTATSVAIIATNTPTRTADNSVSTGNPDYVGGLAVAGSSYAPAYTSGDRAVVAVDKDSGGMLGHIRTLTTTDNVTSTPVASSLANNVAYAASLVVKASSGRLFSVNGYNSKGSAQFIQIHNTTSLPADTAIPRSVITVAASSNFSIDFGPLGIPLSVGITLANSSTGPTLTTGSADVYFTASYT